MSNDKMFFALQPVGSFVRDTVTNRRWIASALCIILTWTVISSALFHYVEPTAQRTWFDDLYFTVINITTVGFGDIVPNSDYGKGLAMANAVFGLISFGGFVAILASALQPSGFTGTGEVSRSPSATPKGDDSLSNKNSDATSSTDDVPAPLGRALDVLAALGAFVDRDQEPNHTHARIILSTDRGGADIVVDLYVDVHRLGRSSDAYPDGHNSRFT